MLVLLAFLFLLLLLLPFSFRRKMLLFYLPALIAVLLTIGMVQYPKEAFEASLNGLAVWWHIVFPALLPFFIFAQVLMGLGVVHFLGVLLEPVMRPVFNVPGEGSFVMAMGLASGFPLGAVLTSKLRQRKMCTKTEAERLLSFVNTADPLFMFGAVAVGMLHAPETGIIIAIAHYLSAITVGLVMRFYRYNKKEQAYIKKIPKKKLFSQALLALVKARQQDGRPFGQILGDTVRDSMNTLMLIGGFIMLFSVIIAMLQLAGIAGFFINIIASFLRIVRLDEALAPALFSGFLEIDLGCQLAGSLQHVSMEQKIIAVSAIIAWSGLSVHAQVASIISPTDISIVPYSLARILHAVLAALYSMLLIGPLQIAYLLF
jgi:sporulation integral membrane protein YlbJ